jgi:predicted nucleotidyltransferase
LTLNAPSFNLKASLRRWVGRGVRHGSAKAVTGVRSPHPPPIIQISDITISDIRYPKFGGHLNPNFDHNDPVLKKIISTLKSEFQPTKLFLFGSRANGTARTESDYDFVVVVQQTDRSQVENLIRTRKLFKENTFSVDAFVYPELEFEDWKNDFGSIPETAVSTGQEIDLGAY